MRAGSIDPSQCVNSNDPLTLKEWTDDDITEDTLLRLPHETLKDRQWCYDKVAFYTWYLKKKNEGTVATNPMTNEKLNAEQVAVIEQQSEDDIIT